MLLRSGQAETSFCQTSLVSETRNIRGKNIHFVQVPEPQRPIEKPLSHAIYRAKQLGRVAQKNNLPLRLFLSGGIDSEAMAYAFLQAGVYFEAVVGRYNLDMNEHDYRNAVSFCQRNDIRIHYIDIDVFHFLENAGAVNYAYELGCRSPQIAVHLFMLDQVKGFPVLAGNPVYCTIKDLDNSVEDQPCELEQITGLPGQTHSVYLRYFEKRRRFGEPFFFQSNPELLLSFLFTETCLSSMRTGEKHHRYSMKCRMYQEGGFAVVPRADKYTGFENYRREYDLRMGTSHGIGFNEKFRFPLEKITLQLSERTSLPIPRELLSILKTVSLTPNTLKEKTTSGTTQLSRRHIVSGALAASLAGWLLPLPVHALECCPPCMAGYCYATNPKDCAAAYESCGE